MRIIRFIIPVYQKPEQVIKCKEAIGNLILPDDVFYDITEIDNNEVNVGFTKAVNVGLREAIKNGEEFAIVLNQDCYLKSNALVEIIQYMDAHPEVAIAAPAQLSSENEDLIINAGGAQAYPMGRHLSGERSKGMYVNDAYVPWVNGACMVVRLKHVVDFGTMDESMFLIGSDSDWCYTARARGFKVGYIANAFCVHEQGVTSGGADEKVQRIMYLDMLQWRNKWIGTDLFRELSMEIFE